MSIPITHKSTTVDPAFTKAFEPLVNFGTWLRQDPFLPIRSMLAPSTPAMDVKETPKAFMLRIDVPGYKLPDLEVGVSGTRLTLTGKKATEPKEEGESYLVCERALADFNRTFNLPEEVDANKIQAELKEGVLSVTVPKMPEARSRKIAITTK